jgi:hypothetical protein
LQVATLSLPRPPDHLPAGIGHHNNYSSSHLALVPGTHQGPNRTVRTWTIDTQSGMPDLGRLSIS